MNRVADIYNTVCKATDCEAIQTECWIDAVELPKELFIRKWSDWLANDAAEKLSDGDFRLDLPDMDFGYWGGYYND